MQMLSAARAVTSTKILIKWLSPKSSPFLSAQTAHYEVEKKQARTQYAI